jgi:ribosome biogenesis protein MAK21
MKKIVIKEVEGLIFRPNVAERARYYAITFLNQIVLTKAANDSEAANSLILLYFRLFDVIVRTLKTEEPAEMPKEQKKRHKKKNRPMKKSELEAKQLVSMDSVNSKMMAAILTGVNRAFPFSQIDSKTFDRHLDTLFTISHIGNFNSALQALTLIFHVQSQRESVSDRFYRSLYDSLFDQRLHSSSKIAMFLNLLFRALKADHSLERIASFIHRLVQTGFEAKVPFLCGSFFLIGEVMREKKDATSMIYDAEKHPIEGEENANEYDSRKREPLYSNAIKSCLWELIPFCKHFHPTVSLYASSLLTDTFITTPADSKNYDPLLNHTMTRFLDRFVFKAPKKVKSVHQGASVMQPKVVSDNGNLLSGGRKKPIVADNDEGEGSELHENAPVNQLDWKDRKNIAPDEVSLI